MNKEYTGKTFDYTVMPCLTVGGWGHVVMFKDENGNYSVGDFDQNNFWMKDLGDKFQNIEHLTKGLDYVDAMPDSHYKGIILSTLESMKGKTGGMELSKKLAFFCELGCWEDDDNRLAYLYDKDFYQYAKKCIKEYSRQKAI